MFTFSERHVTVCHYNDKRSQFLLSIDATDGQRGRTDIRPFYDPYRIGLLCGQRH